MNMPMVVKVLIVIAIVAVISVGGFFVYKKVAQNKLQNGEGPSKSSQQSWQEKGVAISGKYADADVVNFGDKYRIYYSPEPEVTKDFPILSVVSTDGINWRQEEGDRYKMATFPDVINVAEGTYRMYFQKDRVIKSAVSSDGVNWTDEPGVRVDNIENGFTLDNVAASSTIKLGDGSFLMVYRGQENKPYGTEKLPNQYTSYFFYATSKDGLEFQKKGLALDSRNETLKGMADGADLVYWNQDNIRLYFWSYKGIYHVNYDNGKFSNDAIFDFINSESTLEPFPANPPGDPTLIKIKDIWFMYYGQHTKGIYYATYR